MVRFHSKESEYIRRLEESNKDLKKEIEKLKGNKETDVFKKARDKYNACAEKGTEGYRTKQEVDAMRENLLMEKNHRMQVAFEKNELVCHLGQEINWKDDERWKLLDQVDVQQAIICILVVVAIIGFIL